MSLQLIGHEANKALLRQLRAHTLLFTGPQHVGKRQAARWYAALLNCRESLISTPEEPCGKCPHCLQMLAHTHPDYREIAPQETTKSGRASRKPQLRIDDLVPRAGGNPEPLGPWLEQRPHARYRVALIDHAESLSEQAANAFLKFLEEPPSYALIILIGSSSEAVLSTIVSRATPVRFGTVDPARVGEFAAQIGLTDHPAVPLGRLGEIITAREQDQADAYGELRDVCEQYLDALSGPLDQALVCAEQMEKRWDSETHFDLVTLLRASLKRFPARAYAQALDAVARCQDALEAYASTTIAVQLLTLELRAMLNAGRGS